MILAPLILGLACLAVILYERDRVIRREHDRVAHRRLMRELRQHRDTDQ